MPLIRCGGVHYRPVHWSPWRESWMCSRLWRSSSQICPVRQGGRLCGDGDDGDDCGNGDGDDGDGDDGDDCGNGDGDDGDGGNGYDDMTR